MLNQMRWLLLACLILATGRAEAQLASPTCDKTWFSKAAGTIQLADGDFEAICSVTNTGVFEKAVAACGNEQSRCLAARKSCKTPTSTTFDELARCYRAVGDPPLTGRAPSAIPVAAPPPSAEARAEGLAAAGAVSIVAQGVGDFLIQRAEQEVALYAATELQKALCKKYGDVYFPKSCKLLKQSDEDEQPVGLGTLRRALVEDLTILPGNVLASVFDRLKPEHHDEACALDVTYAFAVGVLKERKVVPLFDVDSNDGGHLRLHHYRVRFPDKKERCDATWVSLKNAVGELQQARASYEAQRQVFGIAAALEKANTLEGLTAKQRQLIGLWSDLIQALNDVLTGPAPKDASARAVRAGVALLKEMLPPASGTAIDEGGAIAIAIIEGDWIGIVASVAAAENLGPVLLCKKGATSCELDTKARATLRLVGDVAAADSSAGVTAALERFAAPLGSWRRKYQGGLYLMANGYVGAKFAHEIVQDARSGWALAPVLAVGLELGTNVGDLARIGVFAQAIDVGNVSSVRVAEEDDPSLVHVKVAPEVTAAQLLAPGVFLTVAPWKAPFAVNLGFDWVPELRTVAGDQKSAWHIGGALVVDTPILELYHE